MDQQTYCDEILAAYLGEVRAAATFERLLYDLDLSETQKQKLDLLRRVELHVAAALEPLLHRYGLDPGDLGQTRAAGVAVATAIPDWDALIDRLGPRLLPYIARFDALRDKASPADAAALRLLSEHEHALLRFGSLEATGRGDASAAVLAGVLS